MQKRKGFTLVELVIVIAVIAILAGVLIGTFSSVLTKAQETAKLQEMKAAEHDQKAEDILRKLDNAQWFGWEDLEAKIGEKIQASVTAAMTGEKKISDSDFEKMKTVVTAAVDSAVAKYAVESGSANTGLTAEEVKFIVEQAVSKVGGVTEAQVKAIVNQAVVSVSGSQLTAAQVTKIVDSVAGTAVNKVKESQLTAADLAAALAKVATQTNLVSVQNAIVEAINTATAKQSTLTADEVAKIVSKYVNTDGTVKGNYTWYVVDSQTYELKSTATTEEAAAAEIKEMLVALSTISSSGETFEGKVITIHGLINSQGTGEPSGSETPLTIELDEKWTPIKTFKGTLDGQGATISNIDVTIKIFADETGPSTGSSAVLGYNTLGDWYGDKMGFGFIGVLDGTVQNLTLNYNMQSWSADPGDKYSYFGGVAGVMRVGSVVDGVTVGGTIKAWGRTGGVTGMIYIAKDAATTNVTINNCTITADIENKVTKGTTNVGYGALGGLVGGVYAYIAGKEIQYADRPSWVLSLNNVSINGTTSGATLTCLGNAATTGWDAYKHSTIGYANNVGLVGADNHAIYYVYSSVTNDTLHADGQQYCTFDGTTLTPVAA